MEDKKTLHQVVDDVLSDMESTGFSKDSIAIYRCGFNRMLAIADERGDSCYTQSVRDIFLNDELYLPNGKYCDSRRKLHNRCDRIITSFIDTGEMEWGSHPKRKDYSLKTDGMAQALLRLDDKISEKKLKKGTRNVYKSFVHGFLSHLENNGLSTPTHIKAGDITDFIVSICESHMDSGSLRAGLPGLRLFLSLNHLDHLMVEIPVHLPRKRDILNVYSDDEYSTLDSFIESGELTYRNRAIGIIALDTGLRSVDILGLKKTSIDWKHEIIHIVQEKTEYAFDVPLTARVGNAIADYLLKERPSSNSDFIFLCERTPHSPIISSSGCRKILCKIMKGASIDCSNRSTGTRITRHSAASRLVRKEVPLHVISDALGHKNPESVLVYLTTDEKMMSKCTLSLPPVKGGENR